MMQSSYWEVNSHLIFKKLSTFYGSTSFTSVFRSPSQSLFLATYIQLTPSRLFVMIHFNIILVSMQRSSKWFLLRLGFTYKNLVYFLSIEFYLRRPFLPSLLYHLCDIWCRTCFPIVCFSHMEAVKLGGDDECFLVHKHPQTYINRTLSGMHYFQE